MQERSPAQETGKPRVVLAKPGLDGHDRGVHIVARILRDAGFEVVMTGLRATPESIIRIAVDEDVDIIGLSILSGAHKELAEELLRRLREEGLSIPVVVGGTIGQADRETLRDKGVAAVFPVGSTRSEITESLRRLARGGARLEQGANSHEARRGDGKNTPKNR